MKLDPGIRRDDQIGRVYYKYMNFNEQQQKIIDSVFGAYLISAPVGTGKTTVLAQRVISAIKAGVAPAEILCLTFTNKAAEEMKTRLRQCLADVSQSGEVVINTFHGFCAYFLKAESKALGLTADFVIMDEDEQAAVMNNLLADYPRAPIAREKRAILDLLERLYRYKITQLEIAIGYQVEPVNLPAQLVELGQKYEQVLLQQNAVDFNQLVYLTLRALYLDDELKNKWSRRFKFIQLDEFQDTHLSEYLVVKQLARVHKNLALIGDLDQTIYGWRGSKPKYIAELFKTHFAPVTKLNLSINYRFNPQLLAAIKSVLQNFKQQNTKELTGASAAEGPEKCVQLFAGYNFAEEATSVVSQIKDLRAREPKATIAVLARANQPISDLAEIFAKENIAHITVDQYNFFRRQEVKDIYAYLKIIFNKFDLDAAYRLVERPARAIGQATLNKIRAEGNPVGLKVSDLLSFKNYQLTEPFAPLLDAFAHGRIVVLDTETTGVNFQTDEIIQIYAVELINGRAGEEFHYYIKNQKPVGTSEQVHKLSDQFLRENGHEPKEILGKLKNFVGQAIVVGHNVNFDLTMITNNSARYGLNFQAADYYDTLDLAKRFVQSENYRLSTLAKNLNLASATHSADDDVAATVGLLEYLINLARTGTSKRRELFQEFSKKFVVLAKMIEDWQALITKVRPAEALNKILDDSGLREYYAKEPDSNKRLKSFDALAQLFAQKDDPQKPSNVALQELINYASLVKNLDFLGLEQGKVPIITVHAAKGLEFDYVFLVKLNEFHFPMYKADFEEELRLFYVALTRARAGVYLSYSQFDGFGRPMTPSRLIGLIDPLYVNSC